MKIFLSYPMKIDTESGSMLGGGGVGEGRFGLAVCGWSPFLSYYLGVCGFLICRWYPRGLNQDAFCICIAFALCSFPHYCLHPLFFVTFVCE